MAACAFLISLGLGSNWITINWRVDVNAMSGALTANAMTKQKCGGGSIQIGAAFCQGGDGNGSAAFRRLKAALRCTLVLSRCPVIPRSRSGFLTGQRPYRNVRLPPW